MYKKIIASLMIMVALFYGTSTFAHYHHYRHHYWRHHHWHGHHDNNWWILPAATSLAFITAAAVASSNSHQPHYYRRVSVAFRCQARYGHYVYQGYYRPGGPCFIRAHGQKIGVLRYLAFH